MRRGLVFSAVFAVLLLVLAIGVYAAGTSTSTTIKNTAQSVGTTAVKSVQDIRIQCNSKTSLRDRVNCRLSYRGKVVGAVTYDAEADIVDESCIGLAGENTDKCRNLYSVAAQCYDSAKGAERLSCIREKAGFATRQTLQETSKETKQRYAVLLLYHLQDRIENALEEGKITQEQASDLIAKIVEVKRMILNGESKESIKESLKELRSSWVDLK